MSITNLDEMHPMLPFSSKPMYNMNLPIKINLNTVVLQDKYHKKSVNGYSGSLETRGCEFVSPS